MGLFDFFAQFDMGNPEAQISGSSMFNTAKGQDAGSYFKDQKKRRDAFVPPEPPTPIQYGQPGSSMAGSLMHKLGMKKTPDPLTGPLVGGKTYGKSKEEMLQGAVSKYVPKGYEGLEKSGQVWGNVGLDKNQNALPALDGQPDRPAIPGGVSLRTQSITAKPGQSIDMATAGQRNRPQL